MALLRSRETVERTKVGLAPYRRKLIVQRQSYGCYDIAAKTRFSGQFEAVRKHPLPLLLTPLRKHRGAQPDAVSHGQFVEMTLSNGAENVFVAATVQNLISANHHRDGGTDGRTATMRMLFKHCCGSRDDVDASQCALEYFADRPMYKAADIVVSGSNYFFPVNRRVRSDIDDSYTIESRAMCGINKNCANFLEQTPTAAAV